MKKKFSFKQYHSKRDKQIKEYKDRKGITPKFKAVKPSLQKHLSFLDKGMI